MKTSDIKITVGLDQNNVPDKLLWTAEDGGIEQEEAKAILLSVWDSKKKETLRELNRQVLCAFRAEF